MDLTNLEKIIVSKGLKKQYLAEKMGITTVAFSNKMSGLTEFKASEIDCLIHELNLKPKDVIAIFFNTN